jgi:hypothetical protein
MSTVPSSVRPIVAWTLGCIAGALVWLVLWPSGWREEWGLWTGVIIANAIGVSGTPSLRQRFHGWYGVGAIALTLLVATIIYSVLLRVSPLLAGP